MIRNRRQYVLACSIFLVCTMSGAGAQTAMTDDPSDEGGGGQHEHMHMAPAGGWTFMQDGIVFATFNHQGGPRGGDEVVAPNWWMGMASREGSRGRLTMTGMVSLDPATVGKSGYREIFQTGEALDGRPLIDRQHPHDLFMQLAAIWRVPLGASGGSLTLAGAPVGEPALGPVAFMHRASAADNQTAPLGHHTFDSTHIAFGVVTAAVDRGPFVFEASVFNGREPDERRWNFDFGPLDSLSGRVWFKPTAEWELQVSSGRLRSPEALEPGDVVRSTASASWTRTTGTLVSSVTAGFGRNDTDHGDRQAFFVEGAHQRATVTVFGRVEAVQVETAVLLRDEVGGSHDADTVVAATAGAVRNVAAWRGLQAGVGADVTAYGLPSRLTPAYSSHPISFHVFVRVRPADAAKRMWNMRMSHPM